MGVYTTDLALRHLSRDFSENKILLMKNFKDSLEKIIIDILGENSIIGLKAKSRNLNTINFLIPNVKATLALMAFDLEGIQVSSGSACSSGANIPSRVLTALNIDEKLTRSGIRLSFSKEICLISEKKKSLVLAKFKEILNRYKK